MNVTALIPLHYGAEYLRQCVQALRPAVDRVVVLYTPLPSFGHNTTATCPETEEQLHACVRDLGVEWYRSTFGSEGQHRNAGYALCQGADLILQCDADEVWDTNDLKLCLAEAADLPYRRYKIDGFLHHWRSFGKVCTDTWHVERIIKPTGKDYHTLKGRVHHFGYAQSEEITGYKWKIHGHQDELRPGWFESIFKDEQRTDDLHPTTLNWWNARDYDRSLMPEVLKGHPYYALDLIR